MKRMTFQETIKKMMEKAPEFFKKLHEENEIKLKRAEWDRILKQELELGCPSFKNKIAKILTEKYQLEITEATTLVFEKYVQLIDQDMIWSQHMGSEYWAEVINERR